ncbi:TPA: hypothetical protein N0F65_012280 [Lagenidium giganteum]|uniref:Uncharacterized protein n=1 Tax=Lagenidium giganteum TaxID=4803 RepID=A0AAV2ZHZ5_9STRA|nr:TPA: hypothetical protein N0F65_012280 [Lagenidium giganteum]
MKKGTTATKPPTPATPEPKAPPAAAPSTALTARNTARSQSQDDTADTDELSNGTSTSNPSDSTTTLLQVTQHRKILYNPSAGDVHRREQGSPWRAEWEEKIALTNLRARDEQWEKRRWGLAKQVQDGLMHNFGINYGVSELANLIKEGMLLKKAMAAQSGELSATQVAYVQLLAAAEKYDLKQIVVLLEKFPKGRNAK